MPAFLLGIGVLIGISLSCTASNLSLTATSRVVSPAKRSATLGMVAGIGSFGTFLVGPLAQKLIAGHGWHVAFYAFIALAAVMQMLTDDKPGRSKRKRLEPAPA